MWEFEKVHGCTFFNTQQNVYELISMTPEELLCKNTDAVKASLLIKRCENMEPDKQYGVRLVPLRNVVSRALIDPHSEHSKKYLRQQFLAASFYANGMSDWEKFIPTGLRTLEKKYKDQREKDALRLQNRPFESGFFDENPDSESDGSDYEYDEQDRRQASRFQDSDTDEDDDEDEDADLDDKLYHYDAKKNRFRAGEYPQTENKPAAVSKTQPTAAQQPQTPSQIIEASESTMHDIQARVMRVQEEQRRQREANAQISASDLVRKTAAVISSDAGAADGDEPLIAETSQTFHSQLPVPFDVRKEREAVKMQDQNSCAPAERPKARGEAGKDDVLDRFSASPPTQRQNSTAKSVAPAPNVKKPTVPTAPFTVEQLKAYGSRTRLPPSIESIVGKGASAVTDASKTAPERKNAAPPTSKVDTKSARKRLREIYKLQTQLLSRIQELEEHLLGDEE